MKNNGRQSYGFFSDHKPHSSFSQEWESLALATGGDLIGTE